MVNMDEKKGWSTRRSCICRSFQNFCPSKGLKDMGFQGPLLRIDFLCLNELIELYVIMIESSGFVHNGSSYLQD